jgi:DNA-binding transcriptional MocR family regulator
VKQVGQQLNLKARDEIFKSRTGEFIFGYSQLNEIQIQRGIEKLSQILKD